MLPDIAADIGFSSGFIGSQSTPLSLRPESGKSSIIPAVALLRTSGTPPDGLDCRDVAAVHDTNSQLHSFDCIEAVILNTTICE